MPMHIISDYAIKYTTVSWNKMYSDHYTNFYNVYTIQVISTDSKNTLWQICIHAYAIDIMIIKYIACWWYTPEHISEDKQISYTYFQYFLHLFNLHGCRRIEGSVQWGNDCIIDENINIIVMRYNDIMIINRKCH